MATKDKVSDVRPYVERALQDEDLRDNLKAAFLAARDVYSDLTGDRGMTGLATRVATDRDIQDNLRRAVDELREASDRVRGKEDHSGRNTMLLLAGITLAVLFNPVTGTADAPVDQGEGPRAERRLHLRRRGGAGSHNGG